MSEPPTFWPAYLVGQIASPRRLIVVLGLWAIFGPALFALIQVEVVYLTSTLPEQIHTPVAWPDRVVSACLFAAGLFGAVVVALILFRSTRGYLRNKAAQRAVVQNPVRPGV